MNRILLVCHEIEFSREVRQFLTTVCDAEGQESLVVLSDNFEEAQRHLDDDSLDLVVAHLHIPNSLSAPVDEEAQYGLELLKWIHEQGLSIPSVLIAPEAAATIIHKLSMEIHALPQSLLVFEGPKLWTELSKNVVRNLVNDGDNGASAQSRRLQIEVELGGPMGGKYQVTGVGFSYVRQGPINIDNHALDRLRILSDHVGKAEERQWQETLRLVGEDLRRELFERRNSDFRSALARGLGEAGLSLDGTELRFNVQREFYPVALEAVLDPDTRNYWMLEAPIYRNLPEAGQTVAPLFETNYDDEPSNCLIIDANAHGEVQGFGESGSESIALDYLDSVSQECGDLEDFLNDNRKKLNLGEIRLLRADDVNGPYSEYVQAVIKEGVTYGRNKGGWKLCHYGGHSYYDAVRECGYIFFQNYHDGAIQKVPLNEFSRWLLRTSFVYLSSCESSSADFVFEMAQHQVPAVLGFRWAISDQLATQHARHFYESLVDDRCLERAFLRTRQKMYCDYERERIWAAPILIKQG